MAEYTDNFHLIKPGQDDFYEVDEFNSNADILDAELKKAQDMGNAVYTHTKSSTIHALTGSGNNIKFKATADYAAGDTFAVNGIVVTEKTIDGAVLSTGDFKSGNWVEAALDGTALTFQFRSYAAELSNVLTCTPTSDPPSPPFPIDADLLGGYKPEYYASAAGLGDRYTKAEVDAGLAGKENVFAGVILPPSTMDEVIALGPGTREWIQPVRLPWEPPEIPNAPIRVIFSAIFTDVGALKCCRLRCIDGAINLSEYILEPYGDGFRSAPLATATPPQEYDLPLEAGFSKMYDLSQCNYTRDQFGRVYVKGDVRSVTPFGINTHFTTLPIGFRPVIGTEVEASATFSSDGSSSFFSGRVFIRPEGLIMAATLPTYETKEIVFNFSFLAAPTATQSSQVRMSMPKTRSALPTEPVNKCMCVVDAAGNYVEFVLVTLSQDEEGLLYTVYCYELKDSERLVDADHPTVRPYASADGLIKPRWDFESQAWTEAATPKEITAWELEHSAPPVPAPTLEERNRADIDYLYVMGGLANDLV